MRSSAGTSMAEMASAPKSSFFFWGTYASTLPVSMKSIRYLVMSSPR